MRPRSASRDAPERSIRCACRRHYLVPENKAVLAAQLNTHPYEAEVLRNSKYFGAAHGLVQLPPQNEIVSRPEGARSVCGLDGVFGVSVLDGLARWRNAVPGAGVGLRENRLSLELGIIATAECFLKEQRRRTDVHTTGIGQLWHRGGFVITRGVASTGCVGRRGFARAGPEPSKHQPEHHEPGYRHEHDEGATMPSLQAALMTLPARNSE